MQSWISDSQRDEVAGLCFKVKRCTCFKEERSSLDLKVGGSRSSKGDQICAEVVISDGDVSELDATFGAAVFWQ